MAKVLRFGEDWKPEDLSTCMGKVWVSWIVKDANTVKVYVQMGNGRRAILELPARLVCLEFVDQHGMKDRISIHHGEVDLWRFCDIKGFISPSGLYWIILSF